MYYEEKQVNSFGCVKRDCCWNPCSRPTCKLAIFLANNMGVSNAQVHLTPERGDRRLRVHPTPNTSPAQFPNRKTCLKNKDFFSIYGKVSPFKGLHYDTHLSSFAPRTANRINLLLEKPQRRRRNLEKVSKCCSTSIMNNNMSRKCTLMPLLCGESLSRSNYQMVGNSSAN